MQTSAVGPASTRCRLQKSMTWQLCSRIIWCS